MSTYGRETPAPETYEHPAPLSPAGHADAAAEAIRALNHATIRPGGYVWPSDVDAVVGALTTLVERLPQAIGQAQTWLLAARDAGRVGQDGHTPGGPVDVDEAVSIAWNHLRHATTYLDWVRDALTQARSETSHLTGLAPDPAARPTDTAGSTDRIGDAR